MDEALFARIKAVYDIKDTLSLDDDQMKLLENTYKSRERSGALLEPKEKERLKAINTELTQLTTKYSQNTVKHTAAYERIATKDELKGVPERALNSYKAAAEEAAEADGATTERKAELQDKYLLKLQPHPTEVMSHCDNRDLRLEIDTAFSKIGCEDPFDNRPIVLNIVKLRHEAAQLLGYDNHAHFVTSDRMADHQK